MDQHYIDSFRSWVISLLRRHRTLFILLTSPLIPFAFILLHFGIDGLVLAVSGLFAFICCILFIMPKSKSIIPNLYTRISNHDDRREPLRNMPRIIFREVRLSLLQEKCEPIHIDELLSYLHAKGAVPEILVRGEDSKGVDISKIAELEEKYGEFISVHRVSKSDMFFERMEEHPEFHSECQVELSNLIILCKHEMRSINLEIFKKTPVQSSDENFNDRYTTDIYFKNCVFVS